MPVVPFEGTNLGASLSPKLKEIYLTDDGFPTVNAGAVYESILLQSHAPAGACVFVNEAQMLADEGPQNYGWKVDGSYPILNNDNVTWAQIIRRMAARRFQVFAKDDDGNALNFVRNISNDFVGTPNGSALCTGNGTKRTISMNERKIEVKFQTFLWPACFNWLWDPVQTAGYITAVGNIGGGTASTMYAAADTSTQTPLLPGWWQIKVGANTVGELTECTLTEEIKGNALQWNQFECRELEQILTFKGTQTDGTNVLGAGYYAFNDGAVVGYTPNGEVFTWNSGTFKGSYTVTGFTNGYPSIEGQFKRVLKLNQAATHVNYSTALAPSCTY